MKSVNIIFIILFISSCGSPCEFNVDHVCFVNPSEHNIDKTIMSKMTLVAKRTINRVNDNFYNYFLKRYPVLVEFKKDLTSNGKDVLGVYRMGESYIKLDTTEDYEIKQRCISLSYVLGHEMLHHYVYYWLDNLNHDVPGVFMQATDNPKSSLEWKAFIEADSVCDDIK